MREDLKIALCQSEIKWENPEASLVHYEGLLKKGADLYILPEMFTTGFSMIPSALAEKMNGASVQWLKEKAKEFNAAFCASLIIEDQGYRNRLLFVQPNGKITHYDKKHLFSMAGEHEKFVAGKERVIVEYNGWKILLQVCYDLRFPVFSRNVFNDGRWDYDLLIYTANWPSPRANAWRDLIKARAIENQCYVAAVNRIGMDGNQLKYLGDSALIDPKGNILLSYEQSQEQCDFMSVLSSNLKDYREKFPLGLDADSFTLH